MSEVNVPRLRKAVEWAEAETQKPRELREWEQAFYILPNPKDESAMQRVRGTEWVFEVRQKFGKSQDCGTCFCIAGYVADQVAPGTDYDNCSQVAEEALGLNEYQAGCLFSASNSIGEIRRLAETFAGEKL